MEFDMECREVERIIWMDGPDAVTAEHLTGCRACREESRRAADLQAALLGMRNRFALPPADLEHMIVEAVGRTRIDRAREVVTHPRFWRGAAVGAAAAAGVAGAAIGVIAARRRVAARPEVA
jgi:predicted anti-sigma-YlaC factor YlaD